MPALDLDAAETAFLLAFVQAGVRFVIIGSHAGKIYGQKRPPNDVDIVVERSEANAAKIITAVHGLGEGIAREYLLQPHKKIRVPRYGVDILTSVDAVPFGNLYDEAVRVRVDGTEFPVASKEHWLAQKRSSGRPKDIADGREVEGAGAKGL